MFKQQLAKLKEKREKDLTKERDKNCIPIANSVLKMIAEFEGPLGNVSPEDMQKEYDKLIADILEFYALKGVKIADINYVNSLINQKLEHVKGYTIESINKNMMTVMDKIWGKTQADVTLVEILKKMEEYSESEKSN